MINVLIVDDDRFARMGLISMIPWEKYGMKIVGEAANGKRALEFIQQNPVNLMFVDIAMPVMGGIELIRRVKEEFRQIHFVVLTFHEEFEYVQEALRLGALDYISKDKMEMEDYNDIMHRIRKGIAEDNACFETETENEQLAALEQALGGVLWLYDNYQMDLAAQLLQTGYIHMRSLESSSPRSWRASAPTRRYSSVMCGIWKTRRRRLHTCATAASSTACKFLSRAAPCTRG